MSSFNIFILIVPVHLRSISLPELTLILQLLENCVYLPFAQLLSY